MSIDTAGYWCGEDEGHDCGYCKGKSTSMSTGIYLSFTSPHRYNALIDRGWRRAGMYIYKPIMHKTCCPQYTIKCDALKFRISHNQKKVLLNFIEYLENSAHSSLPTKSKSYISGDVQNEIFQPSVDSDKIILNTAILDSLSPNLSIPSNAENVSSSSSINEAVEPFSVYKTGEILSNSRKKRDFRRLRKLKKIAAARNVSWRTLDVSQLGTQPPPKSLTERLSIANNHTRLELRLVRISDAPESQFQKTFAESHRIFQKYQMAVHMDELDHCDEKCFRRFLCNPPFEQNTKETFGAFHHQYYIDGKLVAVGVLDLLPRCVSSVYFFYDPDYSNLSLGTLSALFELQLIQNLQKKHQELCWYYMGFYIHNCPKMKYKSLFKPSFLLCPKRYTWWAVDVCTTLLDNSKYQEFDTSPEEIPPSEEDLRKLKCLYKRHLYLYPVYKTILCNREPNVYRDILLRLLELTGQESAENIGVYT